MSLDRYHQTRLTFDPRRETLWRCLWRYHFHRYVRSSDCVLELGSGYGHFINNVASRRRIAVDIWPGFLEYLAPGVEGHVGEATDLDFVEDGSVDFAFASNLIEHLAQKDFARLLDQLKRKLSRTGRIALLQPNFRYAFREYFDDYTHVSVYSHVSLCDFLRAQGFEIVECIPRFLPLTIKSRFRVWPILIWLSLRAPIRPLDKQMLVVARLPELTS
ncbi:MAG TPA: class I SAM-dependent methyltransferase [Terriglobia bacterium]|nr:class I SAM-dependent methyltransferase [Terriglobia bacterium]